MITLSALSGVVRQHARRGLITEQGFWIIVAVPSWRVDQTREVMRPYLPLGMNILVKPLTAWQLLTVWAVHVRTS